MLRRKTRRSGRSGQGDAWEEQAQGNGETPVRVMRQRTQARQGGGIPPTKYRAADGGCSAREESSFSPEGATSMRRLGPAPEGAMRGHGRGRVTAEIAKRLRGDGEAGAESPQKQGFGTKPQFRRAEPSGTFLGAADSTGPRPDGVYVYAERPRGRRSPPPRKASTVTTTVAARWKANAQNSQLPEPWPHDVRQTNTHHARQRQAAERQKSAASQTRDSMM